MPAHEVIIGAMVGAVHVLEGHPWKGFVLKRQTKFEEFKAQLPEYPFYKPNVAENRIFYNLYTTEIDPKHEEFSLMERIYIDFATKAEKLNDLVVIPYAAGNKITAADLHIVPWLSHAFWGSSTTGIQVFEPLETLVGKTILGSKLAITLGHGG